MSFTFTSTKVAAIPFAGIRKVFEKAARLESKGAKVIHFEIGRPDFDTPEHIKQAAKLALDQGMVHYTPNAGIPALRKAMAASIKSYKKVEYDPMTEIMATSGGQEAMYLTLQAILNPGDEVLVPNPGYPQFTSCVTLCSAVPVPMALLPEDNFATDLDTAQQIVTSKTRAIIVNSPHNPTGSVLTRKQINALCRFAEKNDLLILSDEAYDRILYDNDFISPAAVEGMKERTIIWGSLSKSYAMTGWRIGYIAAPAALVANTIKVQQNLMLSLCAFAQAGATAALEGPHDIVNDMTTQFRERRKIILDGIAGTPGLSCPTIPQGAFYVFAAHQVPGMNSEQLADRLLDETGVATVPGSCFGSNGEGFLRISYATSKAECMEGMARIKGFMSSLMTP
jgi:aspartate aminotransferase/aminotransferase